MLNPTLRADLRPVFGNSRLGDSSERFYSLIKAYAKMVGLG